MATTTLIRVLKHDTSLRLPYAGLGLILWFASLAMFESRSSRSVGTGAGEYKAILDATLVFVGVYVVIALLGQPGLVRGDIIPAVPLGFAGLLIGRWTWRQWLRRERRSGRALDRVVLLGSPHSSKDIADTLGTNIEAGYQVVAMVTPPPQTDVSGGGAIVNSGTISASHSLASRQMS